MQTAKQQKNKLINKLKKQIRKEKKQIINYFFNYLLFFKSETTEKTYSTILSLISKSFSSLTK